MSRSRVGGNTGQVSEGGCAEFRRGAWQRPVSRRTMLASTLGVVASGAAGSHLLLRGSLLDALGVAHAGADPGANILVVIQQAGGNDGLNTVIPYTSTLYHKLRPTLAIPARAVLPLDNVAGLHPHLSGIKRLWDGGHLAVVQGVGYPQPDLSHFKSMIIWQTCDLTATRDSGWLGRYLDTALAGDPNPLKAINIGDLSPLAFRSRANLTPSLTSLSDFQIYVDAGADQQARMLHAFRSMNADGDPNTTYAAIRATQGATLRSIDTLQAIPSAYAPRVPYPSTDLAKQLKLVAQLIHANLGTRVYWVSQAGYDDHAAEATPHAQLLQELDGAVSAFYADMAARGLDRRLMLMTWSEFGRRVQENGDRGTDHGTAAPMLVIGGGVRGGIYGQDPVLSRLDGDGNLIASTDFRSVYATIIARWMGADPSPVAGGSFPLLPFL